jgi:hypothetical protein
LREAITCLDDVGQVLFKNDLNWAQDAFNVRAQFSVGHRCGVLGPIGWGEPDFRTYVRRLDPLNNLGGRRLKALYSLLTNGGGGHSGYFGTRGDQRN